MVYSDLPQDVKEVCDVSVARLKDILRENLYGIYMYGAAVFPDSGPVTDIDCHVIIRKPMTGNDRDKIYRLYKELADLYPPLGGELDIWYILLGDARNTAPPRHQLKTDMRDESWALHCAHVRAGRYITLHGPEPADIFPPPSWEQISAALEHELDYIEKNLKYPAYCVLNLCRIIYSYRERDAVVSKRFSGRWAGSQFPEWSPLIEAAMKFYEGCTTSEDDNRLQAGVKRFMCFSLERIEESR